MLVKGLVLTAALVSTPLCLVTSQDPRPAPQQPSPQQQPPRAGAAQHADAAAQRAAESLRGAQRELDTARRQVEDLRRQIGELLDRVEEQFQPQQHRNCSPSRSRSLLTHYQWLQHNGHGERAQTTLERAVAEYGNDVNRLNGVAWELMTDKQTVGKFDDVALALARRMEQHAAQHGGQLRHQHLDTVALAHFLNGDVEAAIARQQEAIARGGDSDDYRRRLRTYEAARAQLARHAAPAPAETTAGSAEIVAAGGDE